MARKSDVELIQEKFETAQTQIENALALLDEARNDLINLNMSKSDDWVDSPEGEAFRRVDEVIEEVMELVDKAIGDEAPKRLKPNWKSLYSKK